MDYFENAGRKLGKVLNVAFTIILVIYGLAALAVLFAAISAASVGNFGNFLLVLIVGVLALGILLGVSYLIMLRLAAFAELVKNSNLILQEVKKEGATEENTNKRQEVRPISHTVQGISGVRETVTCPKCGKSQFDGRSTCFSCGASLR